MKNKPLPFVWVVEILQNGEWVPVFSAIFLGEAVDRMEILVNRSMWKFRIRKYVREGK